MLSWWSILALIASLPFCQVRGPKPRTDKNLVLNLAQFRFSLKLFPSLRARKQFGLFKVYFFVHVSKYPSGIPGSLRAR